MRSWLRGHWLGMVSLGLCAAAVALAMVWNGPPAVVATAAINVLIQGVLFGRGWGYEHGFDDGAAMAHKHWRAGVERMQAQAAERAIELTPHELGESYTAMVSHRDRSN
jgi:hypothetical protein